MTLKYLYTAIIVLGLSGLYSCRKYERVEQYPTSIIFQNALFDNTTLFTYFREGRPDNFSELNQILPGQRLLYVTNDMNQYVNFFDYADTLSVKSGILSKPLSLEPNAIYTHFLYSSKDQPKEILLKENIPGYSSSDSITNFRIMNLFGNRSIDVHQTSPVSKALITDLGFEKHSEFIALDCKSADAVFSFEFRDHTTDELLTTTTIINDYGDQVSYYELLYTANTLTLFGTYTGPGDHAAQVGRVPHHF